MKTVLLIAGALVVGIALGIVFSAATIRHLRQRVPGMVCYPEKVFESEILDVVTEAIRQQARCVVDAQRMMEQQKKSQEASVSLLRKKAKKLEALQRELTQRIEKLYEDAVIDNLLSRDAYTAQKARLVEQRDDAHILKNLFPLSKAPCLRSSEMNLLGLMSLTIIRGMLI